jgi:gliding motility-associated-like protein
MLNDLINYAMNKYVLYCKIIFIFIFFNQYSFASVSSSDDFSANISIEFKGVESTGYSLINFSKTMNLDDPGLDSLMNICKESLLVDLFDYLGGTPDIGGTWTNLNGDSISGLILADTIVSGSVFEYEVMGVTNLVSSFVTINVVELTETHISVDSDCQMSNGSITIAALGNLGPIDYSIDNGVTLQPSNVFDNLAAIAHTILVEDSLGCQVTFTQNILNINLPLIASVSVVNNFCHTGTDGEIHVIGTNLNFYSIDGGMTLQSSNVFTGLTAGSYFITGYSSNPLTTSACSATVIAIVSEPSPLYVYDVTPSLMSCPGDDVILTTSSQGGTGNSILTWMDGLGNVLGTGNSITINPTVSTVVTVEMTEGVCPSNTESTSVTMPSTIFPAMTSNLTDGCYPITVDFTNVSANPIDIVSTNWSFSGSNNVNIIGTGSVSAIYDQVGVFDLTMTVTSIYGCVYDFTYINYITVYDHPIASFVHNPILPTMNLPDVVLTSTSSNDVVQWDWSIAGGLPVNAVTENVNATFPQGVSGIYPVALTVWNEFSCVDSTVVQIEVTDGATTIFAPNAFTPNGDSYNQIWKVFVNGINKNDYHIIVYNRRGEVAWESDDPEGEWNGINSRGKIEEGTYAWIVNTRESKNDSKCTFNGTFSILK